MVQLNILAGKKAGGQTAARRFPFRIGRAAGNDLQLDDDGVWDQHVTLNLQKPEGFTLALAPKALASVNDQPVQTALLRNGDIIALGSVKLQFWLAATRQRGLLLRELFVWALIIAVTAAQFALIYGNVLEIY
jgi:pSer/pThr/pTyr-binding forkhead associated (FHA) protein